jgi:hypothetical protein
MIVPRLFVSVASVAPPPPPPPTLSGVTFGVGSYPGDGGGYFRVVFTIDNAVGGEYIEVLYDITAGAPITTTGVGGPAGPFTASPADVSVALGAAPEAEATVNLYDASAFLLDSVFLPDQALPI